MKRCLVKYGFRCALCGEPFSDEAFEFDHIVPLSSARSPADAEKLNSEDNVQPVHRACHQRKSAREASACQRGA